VKAFLELKAWLESLITSGDTWQRLLWPWAIPSDCFVRLAVPVEDDEPYGSGPRKLS